MSSDLLDKSKEEQVVDCESSSVGDLLKKCQVNHVVVTEQLRDSLKSKPLYRREEDQWRNSLL